VCAKKVTHNLRTIINQLRMVCEVEYFSVIRTLSVTSAKHASHIRHMFANHQWKDVDERNSGNIFAYDQ
jgi:hypothetical protein